MRVKGREPQDIPADCEGVCQRSEPEEGLGVNEGEGEQSKEGSGPRVNSTVVSKVRAEGLVASAGTFAIGWRGLTSCSMG